MLSEAALNLSFLELVQALNEKVTLKCTRVREMRFSRGVAFVTALKTEVSTPRSIYLDPSAGKI